MPQACPLQSHHRHPGGAVQQSRRDECMAGECGQRRGAPSSESGLETSSPCAQPLPSTSFLRLWNTLCLFQALALGRFLFFPVANPEARCSLVLSAYCKSEFSELPGHSMIAELTLRSAYLGPAATGGGPDSPHLLISSK